MDGGRTRGGGENEGPEKNACWDELLPASPPLIRPLGPRFTVTRVGMESSNGLEVFPIRPQRDDYESQAAKEGRENHPSSS